MILFPNHRPLFEYNKNPFSLKMSGNTLSSILVCIIFQSAEHRRKVKLLLHKQGLPPFLIQRILFYYDPTIHLIKMNYQGVDQQRLLSMYYFHKLLISNSDECVLGYSRRKEKNQTESENPIIESVD